MRAAVYHGREDIRVEDVPDPSDPGAGWMTLEVSRAAICGTDSAEWAHGPLLARPPVVLGHEFVGTVASLGAGVEDFAIGDRVVPGSGVWCRRCAWCRAGRTNLCADYYTLGLHADGGLAEQVSVPTFICQRVPEGVSDEAAAMAQPLAVALHAIRRSGLTDDCAVIGVGGIGAFIVAAAAARGPSSLIALDLDEERLRIASRLGATTTIDVRERDLAEAILDHTGGEGAAVVIESSGAPTAPAAAFRAVRRGGRVVLVGLQSEPREIDLLDLTIREVEVTTTVAHVCDVDLPEAVQLLSTTAIAEVVLDRVVSLDALVEAGIRPLAERRASGKIVVATAQERGDL